MKKRAGDAGLTVPSRDDGFVSVAAAADYLGVDPRTIRNMLHDGRLRGYTLGHRTLRIRLSEIDAAMSPYGGAHVN
jgi:excisionase family DNA binding protein